MSRPPAVGKTNSAGQVQLRGTFPIDAQETKVLLMPRSTYLAQEGSVAEEDRYHAVLDAHAFWKEYVVQLTTDTSYAIAIVGQDAVSVTGQLTWVGDQPEACDIQATGVAIRDHRFGPEEAFEIKGVRQNAPAELYVYAQDRQQMLVMSLSATQTATTVNLGTIPGPERTQGRSAVVTMLRAAEVNELSSGRMNRSEGGVIIRMDGGVIYWGNNPFGTGSLRSVEHDDGKLRLPPGSYFCVPGYFAGTHTQASRLLSLLRAGRAAEVEAALTAVGISKLVIPDDGGTEPVSYSFDAVQTEAAIRSVQ
jgi:hypothetical protein